MLAKYGLAVTSRTSCAQDIHTLQLLHEYYMTATLVSHYN